MQSIKNIKFDIYQLSPISFSCNSYSKLLDITIRLTIGGLKLDISYLENDDSDIKKKFYFLIKRVNDCVDEPGFCFLKMFDIIISDSIERYYVFYKEECDDGENRSKKLHQLGV